MRPLDRLTLRAVLEELGSTLLRFWNSEVTES
jgi:very-short-patch-repair endonuclease